MDGSQVAVAVAIGVVIFLAVTAANRNRQSGRRNVSDTDRRADGGDVAPMTAIGMTASARGGGMVDDDGRPGHTPSDGAGAGDSRGSDNGGAGDNGGDGGGDGSGSGGGGGD